MTVDDVKSGEAQHKAHQLQQRGCIWVSSAASFGEGAGWWWQPQDGRIGKELRRVREVYRKIDFGEDPRALAGIAACSVDIALRVVISELLLSYKEGGTSIFDKGTIDEKILKLHSEYAGSNDRNIRIVFFLSVLGILQSRKDYDPRLLQVLDWTYYARNPSDRPLFETKAGQDLSCIMSPQTADFWQSIESMASIGENTKNAEGGCAKEGCTKVESAHSKFLRMTVEAARRGRIRMQEHSKILKRRPEALHGCVLVNGGEVIGTGYNYTYFDEDRDTQQDFDEEDLLELQSLIGDHRQWQKEYVEIKKREQQRDEYDDRDDDADVKRERRGGVEKAGNPVQIRTPRRTSLHAEQHAILNAVRSIRSSIGEVNKSSKSSPDIKKWFLEREIHCYIAEVSEEFNCEVYHEAYPCSVCLPLLQLFNVKKVYFTTSTMSEGCDGLMEMRLTNSNPQDFTVAEEEEKEGREKEEVVEEGLVEESLAWHIGRIKPWTGKMRNFGFISCTEEDVFFSIRSLEIPRESSAENLRSFPDGRPMLRQAFSDYFGGKLVKFTLKKEESGRDTLRPEAEFVVLLDEDEGH